MSRLGRALDPVVVAEGVEDMAMRDLILANAIDVDRLQGFAIARPMGADDLLVWLAGRDRAASLV